LIYLLPLSTLRFRHLTPSVVVYGGKSWANMGAIRILSVSYGNSILAWVPARGGNGSWMPESTPEGFCIFSDPESKILWITGPVPGVVTFYFGR